MQGTQQFRPPRIDPNAPDLYIPIMAAWTYVILLCGNALLSQSYTPDLMYAMVGGDQAARLRMPKSVRPGCANYPYMPGCA